MLLSASGGMGPCKKDNCKDKGDNEEKTANGTTNKPGVAIRFSFNFPFFFFLLWGAWFYD